MWQHRCCKGGCFTTVLCVCDCDLKQAGVYERTAPLGMYAGSPVCWGRTWRWLTKPAASACCSQVSEEHPEGLVFWVYQQGLCQWVLHVLNVLGVVTADWAGLEQRNRVGMRWPTPTYLAWVATTSTSRSPLVSRCRGLLPCGHNCCMAAAWLQTRGTVTNLLQKRRQRHTSAALGTLQVTAITKRRETLSWFSSWF